MVARAIEPSSTNMASCCVLSHPADGSSQPQWPCAHREQRLAYRCHKCAKLGELGRLSCDAEDIAKYMAISNVYCCVRPSFVVTR